MRSARQPFRRPPDPQPAVLELRVHGVNNTAPHAVLDLPAADVEQVAGDDLGSFWRPTDAASARIEPGSRGYVPPGVVREAYSWGGLARTSVGGQGALGSAVGVASRIGWALLVPFGLVNLAFWSRRLAAGRAWSNGWQDDASAALIRLFSLGLTLLLLATTSVVSLDLVMTQCFAESRRWCPRLPAVLDGLARLSDGERLVLGAVVPVAVLLLLAVLAGATRSRYEQIAALPQASRTRAADRDGPALATPGFWSNARLTALLGRLHLAAGLCLLVVLTATPQLSARVAGEFVATSVLAVVGLIVIAGWLGSHGFAAAALPGTPAGRRLARRVTLGTAAVGGLFVVHLVLLATIPGVRAAAGGLAVAPTVLAAVLLVIAASAVRWRRAAGSDDGRHEAWGGRAPAVFLALALGAALTLSSMLVVGTGDWLNGSRSAGELLHLPAATPGSVAPDRSGCDAACPVPAPLLSIPAVYVWFGAAIGIGLLVLLLVGVIAALRTSRSLPRAGCAASTPAAAPDVLGSRVEDRPGAGDAVLRARWWAGVAHRAEPLTGVMAVATGVSVALALAFTVLVGVRPELGPPQVSGRLPVGTAESAYAAIAGGTAWGAGAVGLLVLGGLVGGAAIGRTRPLGLLWDLICFLPRTGHPFGPPCYAERVVPELVRRCATWVGPARRHETGPGRRVVLSAHSLGAVLAVASVVALRAEHGARVADRLSLLTYGCQLRAYLGRMFPELLGPAVLGTPPSRGARLFTADPWRDALAEDSRRTEEGHAAPGSLSALLTDPSGDVRWISLWRRTDYLGFPVRSWAGGPLDRPAEEIDTSGYLPEIGTHGGYPRVIAYTVALDHLRR